MISYDYKYSAITKSISSISYFNAQKNSERYNYDITNFKTKSIYWIINFLIMIHYLLNLRKFQAGIKNY